VTAGRLDMANMESKAEAKTSDGRDESWAVDEWTQNRRTNRDRHMSIS